MNAVLMEQHERHQAARARLWGRTMALPVAAERVRPVSPFRRPAPRWVRLFVRPIEELDEYGNVVIEGLYMPQWKRIALEVCEKYQIGFNEIISARRNRYVVKARHEAFWRCKKETSLSLPQIGHRFGGRDHTTVIHGIRAHEGRMHNDA